MTTWWCRTASPRAIPTRRPASGPARGPASVWSMITVLGFLAAATSRVRLVTSVMVVPQRPAVLAAKALATVDVLSSGPPHRGRRRRVDGRGVPGRRGAAVLRARPRHRRIPRRVSRALDERGAALRGPPRPLRRHPLRAQAASEAAPADLDRRRERGGAAPRRADRRRLVSRRQQSARSARHARPATPRRAGDSTTS